MKQMYAKHRLRFSQPLDIYTGCFLPFSERTIEHLIPQKILRHCYPKKVCQDPLNLFVTTAHMNQYRADFKFGHEPCLRSIHPQCDVDTKIFFPIMNQKLIAYSIVSMYNKYPRLETMHNDIFAREDILDIWMKQAWTCTELKMLQWKWLIFGTPCL